MWCRVQMTIGVVVCQRWDQDGIHATRRLASAFTPNQRVGWDKPEIRLAEAFYSPNI
jgi:hypothetical protein